MVDLKKQGDIALAKIKQAFGRKDHFVQDNEEEKKQDFEVKD